MLNDMINNHSISCTKGKQWLAFWSILLLLTGCNSAGNYSGVDLTTMDDIQSAIKDGFDATVKVDSDPVTQPPADVLQALVPGLTLNSESLQPVEERFDFVVQQPMDAREFFALLTSGTEYSVAVHPGVSGSISALDLKNVSLQEALDQVSDLYGFVINKQGNIYQVLPGGLQTRIFYVDYLNVARSGSSNMQIVATGITQGQSALGTAGFSQAAGALNAFGARGGAGGNAAAGLLNGAGAGGGSGIGSSNTGGASINTATQSDYWQGLEEVILEIINSGQVRQSQSGVAEVLTQSANNERSVIVSPQTGMVVVRAFPEELSQVEDFLSASQEALQRQVILEAKILEVELKENFQSGIDLTALGKVNSNNEVSAEFSFFGDSLDAIGSPMAVSYDSTDFNAVIQLLESQGNVQVISSPRISTLNNQKAVFKVGDEQFFLTEANTVSFGAGDLATTNQNNNLQPFFSGIALDVTPQISAGGDITLHIHPILSQVKEDIKVIGGQEFPLANSTTRESDSIARARNGEVIVISGLMQTRSRGQEAGVPGVKDFPVLGNAFEQRQRETIKTELVILLRALVDQDTMMQEVLNEHKEGFENIRKEIDPYYR